MLFFFKSKQVIKKKILEYKFFRKYLFKYSKSLKKLSIFDNLKLKKNSIFIDIGANEGLISMYINDKFKCKIQSYEPHNGCFIYLKKIFKNSKNINLFNAAVSNNSKKKQKLFLHKKSKNQQETLYAQGSSLEPKKDNIDQTKFIITKVVSIDKIIKKHKFIDAIKIDIETHEYKILPSIFRNMHKIGKVYCELNGKNKYQYLKPKYNFWVNKLKKNNYYGSKFIEWS